MRLTKFGHACVRLETGDARLVIDPGGFTEVAAVEGATAVLVTHEHPDHLDVEHLRRTDAPIHTIAAVAARIRADAPDVAERVHVVRPGERLDLGVRVDVVGETHAVIHPDYDRLDNSGYVIEVEGRRIYHPGDSLTLPDTGVDVLCLPVSAPWLKVSEAVDFARAVGAPLNLGIHDKIYSEVALTMVDTHLGNLLPEEQRFVRVPDGADLETA